MTEETTTTNLVPLEDEAEQRGFDVVLRGYDRTQVDRHVAWLEELLASEEAKAKVAEQNVNAAQEEVARARRDAGAMQAQLQRGKPTYEALGQRIGQMLALAEQEAEALRATGRTEAQALQGNLQQQEAVAAKEREGRNRAAEQEAAALVRRAREEADRVVGEARRQAAGTTQTAQQQVEQLARQRDAIRAELTRLRDGLAAAMGGPAPGA